jgi:hypothetical protein
MADNRRSSTRHAVSLVASVVIGGAAQNVKVVNLSLGGALFAASPRIPMGTRLTISFVVPAMSEAIEVGATVRWSDDNGTGVQFDGLRARDVWALNKYFEQLSPS